MGAWALGSFASAFLVSIFGLQTTLFIGGFGTTLCLVVLLRRGVSKGNDIEYTSSFLEEMIVMHKVLKGTDIEK